MKARNEGVGKSQFTYILGDAYWGRAPSVGLPKRFPSEIIKLVEDIEQCIALFHFFD
jgi:hypothetical protein